MIRKILTADHSGPSYYATDLLFDRNGMEAFVNKVDELFKNGDIGCGGDSPSKLLTGELDGLYCDIGGTLVMRKSKDADLFNVGLVYDSENIKYTLDEDENYDLSIDEILEDTFSDALVEISSSISDEDSEPTINIYVRGEMMSLEDLYKKLG